MPTLNKPVKKPRITNKESYQIRHSVYDTTRWRELRQAKLIRDPLCELCLLSGRITPAECVHHLESFTSAKGAKRYSLAYDFHNLASLCTNCHSTLHARHQEELVRNQILESRKE